MDPILDNLLEETAPLKRYFTEQEYLLIERQSDYKSEFYQGEIFKMSGARAVHNRIKENLSGEFYIFLKGKPCQGFSSDMRIHIPSNSLYTYPDFLVVCGKPELVEDTFKDILLNPIIIVELLSKSTSRYDRGKKFELYKEITSLKQYVLVDSVQKYKTESFTLSSPGHWEGHSLTSESHKIYFPAINYHLSIKDIYNGVDF